MSKRIELFLNQFDSNFKIQIIEFSKRLTNLSNEYEVLIFLARKAACLADCLDELELTNFHCVITSSRILDIDLSWLKNKKIAIIDDALISGTTINEALQKLKIYGINNADVFVLSVDENWWAKKLVSPKPPYLKLNSDQTSLICSNIVNAISVVPRPYTIDYPLFKNIRIREKDFQDLSNSSSWIAYESTSSHQAKHNILNLTIQPSTATELLFFDEIGLDIKQNYLLKLRIYAVSIKNIFWCQLLPIVILPPITEKELNKLFYKICSFSEFSGLCDWFESSSEEDSLKSKLRLVQYYLGSRLSKFWYTDIITKIDSSLILEQDFKNLNFLFPPPISNAIKSLSDQTNIHFGDLQVQFTYQIEEQPTQLPDKDFNESVALLKLAKPFLALYQNKEIKARKLVKELGSKVFENSEYKSTVNRLNQGYSVSDLKNYLIGISNSVNPDKLVSYFLDLYIDKGAVVPITYINNDLIFRAFRHGEDVEFSENEIRLSVSMLEKFSKEYGDTKLPHTIVEKLLVLFVRMGVEKDFLSISTNPISDFSTIGIRYYLHGAVVGSFDKSIYKVNFENSLTQLLEESGYLSRDRQKDYYTLNEFPSTGVDAKGVSLANQLGLVMGNLLKQHKPKITLDELILMATCPYSIDVVGALAAEVYIFQNFFSFQRQTFFSPFPENKIEEFVKVRRQKAFTAINSGTWKFENYKLGTPWKAIDKASKSFSNELYKEVWNSFWPSTGKETSVYSSNPHTIELVKKLAELLYQLRFYINLIELSLSRTLQEFRETKANSESQDILYKTKEYLPEFHQSIKKVYDRAINKYRGNELKKEELYNFSLERINESFQLSRQLLSEVDILANSFGKVEKISYYDHAVAIDFKSFDIPYGKLISIFNKAVNQIKIEAKKTDQVYLFEIPTQYAAIKTGIWICSQGKNSRRWLLKLCSKVIESLDNNSTLKFTFFFNLGTFRIIKKATSNECYAPLFWDIAKELLKKKFKLYNGHEIIYFTSSISNKPSIENEVNNELKDFKKIEGQEKDVVIMNPYNIKLASNHYTRNRKLPIKNLMDIGIITIVAEELAAVTDYFQENNTYSEKRGTQTARTFYFGKLTDKDNKLLNVVATQAIEQGNRSVISVYNALAEEFNPRMIVLLGIAGSIHKDLNICDVAICDSTYYYDKRSITEKGNQHRIDPFKVNAWTKEFIRKYHHAKKSEEPEFDSSENSFSSKFKSCCGPIGTGEAVIKFKEAEERLWLESVNDKTLAVETEAGGAAQQFYEDELSYSRRSKGILIIRGISDKADFEKKNEWRLAASKNAMKVLVEIIKCNSLD